MLKHLKEVEYDGRQIVIHTEADEEGNFKCEVLPHWVYTIVARGRVATNEAYWLTNLTTSGKSTLFLRTGEGRTGGDDASTPRDRRPRANLIFTIDNLDRKSETGYSITHNRLCTGISFRKHPHLAVVLQDSGVLANYAARMVVKPALQSTTIFQLEDKLNAERPI
jgi:hypothetical protein